VRVVVDTNVWVSALIMPVGPSGRVVNAIRRGTLRAVATFALAREVVEVMARPRLRRYGIDREDATEILILLSPMLPDVEVDLPVRDSKDLAVLAAALAGGAEAIVTGDGDLLDDAPLRALLLERSIEVLAPAELIERLGTP